LNTVIRHIVSRTYKPLLDKYLSSTRLYKYQGLTLEVPSDVFHPGFFFSTKLLLSYLKQLDLSNRSFLELGCGSGLLSIVAAKRNARVTATDINPIAVKAAQANGRKNGVELHVIESDLFNRIPIQQFDVIAINPPYYKKAPLTNRDFAWLCGENGEYFSGLFAGLKEYIHASSVVLMVLFEGCDLVMIEQFAAANGFELRCVHSRQNLLEKNFIFQIITR